MLPDPPRSFQIPPILPDPPRSSQILRDPRISSSDPLQILPDPPRSSPIFQYPSNSLRSPRIHRDAPKSSQILPDAPRCSQILPDPFTSSQILPDPPRSYQIPPDSHCSTWPSNSQLCAQGLILIVWTPASAGIQTISIKPCLPLLPGPAKPKSQLWWVLNPRSFHIGGPF